MSFLGRIILAAAAILPFAGFSANTIWVDRQNGNDGYVGEGLGSEAHPFASIQAAVDAATDGDTIKVLPGVYDNGGYVDDKGHSNRVYIAKRIHLVSTGDAENTIIKGRWDSGDTANNSTNLAGDGVRCVRINNSRKNKNGYGAVVQGFTLLDGYAAKAHGYGAAVFCASADGAYIVDCVIRNCSATSEGTGAIMLFGTYVRCAVYDCISWSVVVEGKVWNCAFSGNKINRGVFANTTKAVNCSLYYNLDLGSLSSYITFNDGCGVYNCAVTGWRKHHQAATPSVNTVENKTGIFVDPANGDWRLAPGSPAIGIADAAALTNHFDFSEAAFPISLTDMAGNPLPLTGTINAGAVQTVRTADTWWVDRKKGDDTYEGEGLGTADHPYASIQAAVERARDGDQVKVLPGDYDNGGYVDDKGHSNRVYIAKRIHLVSTGGAAVTTIRGKHDSGDKALSGANLAGDGVRCVRVLSTILDKNEFFNVIGHGTVIEGFTLADGYAAKSHGYGGAQLSTIERYGVFMVDCVITNCTGTSVAESSNGVILGGTLVRCAVLDSPKTWSIVVGARAWNSVFSGNSAVRGVFARTYACNCSLSNNEGCSYVYFSSNDNDGGMYGIVSVGSKPNNITNRVISVVNSRVHQQSAYVDSPNGDWRLMPDSPAIGIADALDYTNAVDFSQTPFPIARTDFYGAVMPLSGAVNAGAVQSVAAYIRVDEPKNGGWDVSPITQGTNQYIALTGSDVTVSIKPNLATAKRLIVGLVTNGVELALEDVQDGIVVTVPNVGGSKFELSYLYGTNWYVNAATGNDANSGFTSNEAFATLAAACTNENLLAGDVIQVAEGVYSNGVVSVKGSDVGARAYVKSGVTLQSEGSKENTLIVGAPAPAENIDNPQGLTGVSVTGCGRGCVRGVFLENNATVRGFTICGGRTRGYITGATTTSEYCGGGVAGANKQPSELSSRFVEDCIITNNAASWGGSVYGVTVRRSIIRNNTAERYGGNGAESSYESTLLGTFKGGSYGLFVAHGLLNTTITEEEASKSLYISSLIQVPTNSIFLVKIPSDTRSSNSVGCVYAKFSSTGNIVMPGRLSDTSTSIFVDNRASLGLDQAWRPLKSSMAVDFCREASSSSLSLDLDGKARVMNGVVDCGAYEYDWRNDYASDICVRRKMTVIKASAAVIEVEGKVRLVDGCQIDANWAHGVDAKCMFPVSINGTGSLAMYVNGSLVATLTSADEAFSWDATTKESSIRFVFSGEGYAELGKAKNNRRMIITVL